MASKIIKNGRPHSCELNLRGSSLATSSMGAPDATQLTKSPKPSAPPGCKYVLALKGSDYMATKYYVNKNAQDNGDHEVHVPTCSFFPAAENRLYLGEFSHCRYAVTEAKKTYPQSNGCYYCCNECHTG